MHARHSIAHPTAALPPPLACHHRARLSPRSAAADIAPSRRRAAAAAASPRSPWNRPLAVTAAAGVADALEPRRLSPHAAPDGALRRIEHRDDDRLQAARPRRMRPRPRLPGLAPRRPAAARGRRLVDGRARRHPPHARVSLRLLPPRRRRPRLCGSAAASQQPPVSPPARKLPLGLTLCAVAAAVGTSAALASAAPCSQASLLYAQALGWVGSAIAACQFAPQLLATWRQRGSGALSYATYLLQTAGSLLVVLNQAVFQQDSWPVWLPVLVSAAMQAREIHISAHLGMSPHLGTSPRLGPSPHASPHATPHSSRRACSRSASSSTGPAAAQPPPPARPRARCSRSSTRARKMGAERRPGGGNRCCKARCRRSRQRTGPRRRAGSRSPWARQWRRGEGGLGDI